MSNNTDLTFRQTKQKFGLLKKITDTGYYTNRRTRNTKSVVSFPTRVKMSHHTISVLTCFREGKSCGRYLRKCPLY